MKRLNERRVGPGVRASRPWLNWLKGCVFGATLATPMVAVAASGAPDPESSGPVVPSTGGPTEAAGRDFSQTSYQPASREPPRERQETPAAQSDFIPAAHEAVRVGRAPASQANYPPAAAEGR